MPSGGREHLCVSSPRAANHLSLFYFFIFLVSRLSPPEESGHKTCSRSFFGFLCRWLRGLNNGRSGSFIRMCFFLAPSLPPLREFTLLWGLLLLFFPSDGVNAPPHPDKTGMFATKNQQQWWSPPKLFVLTEGYVLSCSS